MTTPEERIKLQWATPGMWQMITNRNSHQTIDISGDLNTWNSTTTRSWYRRVWMGIRYGSPDGPCIVFHSNGSVSFNRCSFRVALKLLLMVKSEIQQVDTAALRVQDTDMNLDEIISEMEHKPDATFLLDWIHSYVGKTRNPELSPIADAINAYYDAVENE